MLSRISSADAPLGHGDRGWHDSASEGYPSYAGILLPTPQVVTHLAFLAHYNPFADFKLQRSNDRSTGFDGQWTCCLRPSRTPRPKRFPTTGAFQTPQP